MYRKKDDLQILIEAMSQAEKRHFSHFYSAQNKKGNSSYLNLFESLVKGETPVVKSSALQAMTIAKRTLYQNILKSLTSFHINRSEASLENKLHEVEILYEKNLPDQSMRILSKAKTEATKQEKFGMIIQLLEWERKLSALIDNPPRTIAQIAEEEQGIADCLNNIFRLERLFSKVIEYKKNFGYARGDAKKQLQAEIINHPALTDPNFCLSQKALYYFYYTNALAHFMIYDYEMSYASSKKLLSLNRNIIPLHEYLNGILHHTTSCICSGLFEETLFYLRLAQNLIHDNQIDLFNILSLKVFYYKSNYEMVCCMYMGEVDKTWNIIREIEDSLTRFKERVPLEMRQVISCGLRNAYLSTGAVDDVNRLIDIMLNKGIKLTRNDIYDDLILFRLIWLIQEKSFDIISSVARSSYRYYSGYPIEDNRFDIELKVSKLLIKDHDYDQSKYLQGLLLNIRQIFSDHILRLSPKNQFLEHYTYYLIWIDSMLKQRKFSDEAKDWHSSFMDKGTTNTITSL